jgi:hypothetical protein
VLKHEEIDIERGRTDRNVALDDEVGITIT